MVRTPEKTDGLCRLRKRNPPPAEAEEQSDDLGATDSDTEDHESVERMMGFARNFAESISAGDDVLEVEVDNIVRNSPDLAEGEESQLVIIEAFEYDFADICTYRVHPMNWKPPCDTSVFMMPPMLYMVHGSNGTITQVEPGIMELPLNKMRRRFLRLLLSSFFRSDSQTRGQELTDQESRKAVNTLTDEQLLRE